MSGARILLVAVFVAAFLGLWTTLLPAASLQVEDERAIMSPAGETQLFEQDANYLFCLPLHGYDGTVGCDARPLAYCYGPETVTPNTPVTILLLAYYFERLASVQVAFEWDAGWKFLYSTWDCLQGQTTVVVPHDPGGAEAGTLSTAFDCLKGGWDGPAPIIGRLHFLSGDGGCVRLVESAYLNGTHVTDCQGFVYRIQSNRWWLRTGIVCAGPGGYDGCYDPNSVEPSTWGGIKATWGR